MGREEAGPEHDRQGQMELLNFRPPEMVSFQPALTLGMGHVMMLQFGVVRVGYAWLFEYAIAALLMVSLSRRSDGWADVDWTAICLGEFRSWPTS